MSTASLLIELGTEELVEGGENRFAHQLPTGLRHGNLVLKRGHPRARGRFGKIVKPFSELTIKVRQVGEQA